MTVTAIILICLMSTTLPAVVRRLLPPVPAADHGSPAMVVVPGAGRLRVGEHWRLNTAGRRRLEAGIAEARRRGLPLLVSGGGKSEVSEQAPSEADLMAGLAARVAPDLVVIRERRSRNTWENAVRSAELLAARRIDHVVLVTDRPHLARAVLCFRARGLAVEPVAASSLPGPGWVPSTAALAMLPELWYEWVALFWYELKYF